jgi:hypothetical protein
MVMDIVPNTCCGLFFEGFRRNDFRRKGANGVRRSGRSSPRGLNEEPRAFHGVRHQAFAGAVTGFGGGWPGRRPGGGRGIQYGLRPCWTGGEFRPMHRRAAPKALHNRGEGLGGPWSFRSGLGQVAGAARRHATTEKPGVGGSRMSPLHRIGLNRRAGRAPTRGGRSGRAGLLWTAMAG